MSTQQQPDHACIGRACLITPRNLSYSTLKNRMKRDRQTDNGHRDSMIESAQWADSMKMVLPAVCDGTTIHVQALLGVCN